MRNFFSITMLSIFAIGYSQHVTLKELVEWRAKPHDAIKAYFIEAKWLLVNESNSTENALGQINFSSSERSDKNSVNLDVFYQLGAPQQTQMLLRSKNKAWVESVKAELEALGFAFVSREVVSGVTSVKYKGEKTTVTLTTERPVGPSPAHYQVLVMSNEYRKPNRYNLEEE